MPQQSINLYQAFADPKPKTALLNWKAFMIGNAAAIAILFLITAYTQLSLHFLEKQKTSLQTQADQLQNAFKSKTEHQKLHFTSNINQSLNDLTREIKAQEAILQKIANHSLFSDDLEALSRTITEGVWLTDIDISKSGDAITLTGKSLSSAKLQDYLTKLTADSLFHDYVFSVKNIEDDTSTTNQSDFTFNISLVKK